MKIYILTCVNEESELVYARPYKLEIGAHIAMTEAILAEYESEKERVGYMDIGERSGAIGNDDWCYLYTIVEEELI